MTTRAKDDDYSTDKNTIMENLVDDFSDSESLQAESNGKQYNICARRKIEDYLEEKRLEFLTRDYYFAD